MRLNPLCQWCALGGAGQSVWAVADEQELAKEFSRLCKPEYLEDATRKVLLDQRGAFPGTPLRDVDMSQITVIDPNFAATSGMIIPRAEE